MTSSHSKYIQQTGAAALLGDAVAPTATFLPPIGVLWVFYLATGLLTSVISNNASVVLMIPVAANAAQSIGANAFAFVLAVTFAASTAFMTPVGYQTNLFVYGPGGYTLSDFIRVGAPLQFLLSIATVLGVAFFWGVQTRVARSSSVSHAAVTCPPFVGVVRTLIDLAAFLEAWSSFQTNANSSCGHVPS